MLCVRKNLKCSSCIVPYFYQKFRKYRARNVLFGRFVSPIPTFLRLSCFPRVLRPVSPFLFPPSLSFSFFPRPLRSLVNLVSAICTAFIIWISFPFVQSCALYLVLDPLSPLYICFVRSPFDRQRGDDRFSTLSTSTRFDRTRFVRLSIPGSCMAIVVTELVVDIFARILFVSAKGTCNIPVSFVENRYKLDVNRW